jgi:hypothetical protein
MADPRTRTLVSPDGNTVIKQQSVDGVTWKTVARNTDPELQVDNAVADADVARDEKTVDLSQPLPSSAPRLKVDVNAAGAGKGAIQAIGDSNEAQDAALDAQVAKRAAALKADDPGVAGTIVRQGGQGVLSGAGDELFSQLGSLGVMKAAARKMPQGTGQGVVSLPADPAARAALQKRRRMPHPAEDPETAAIPKTYAAGSEEEDMRRNLEAEFARGKLSRPGLSAASNLAGAAAQGALAGPLLRGASSALGIAPRLAGTATAAAGAEAPGVASAIPRMALTGGAAGGAGAAANAAGNAQPGQRLRAAGEAAPMGALFGATLAPLVGGAMGLTARFPRGLRGRPDMASLPIAEQLDPAIQTRTGVVPKALGGSGVGIDPVTASPKIQAAQAAQAAGEGINTTGKGRALDITLDKSSQAVIKSANGLREDNRALINNYMQEYAAGPHGDFKRAQNNVFSAIEDYIAEGVDTEGRPLPDEDIAELKAWLHHWGVGKALPPGANPGPDESWTTRAEAEKHGVPIEPGTHRLLPREEGSARAADTVRPPAPTSTGPRFSTEREAASSGAAERVAQKRAERARGQEKILLSPRPMTAMEMEHALSNTYDKARPGEKVQRNALKSEKIASRIRAERDSYPGGFGQARQKHADDTADVERTLKSSGMDIKLRDIDPEDPHLREMVKSALTSRKITPELKALLKDPEGRQAIDDAYAHGAFDDVLSVADPVNTIAKGFRHNAMLRLDAVARAVSGTGRSTVAGIERSPAQRTATMRDRVGFANNLARLVGQQQEQRQ